VAQTQVEAHSGNPTSQLAQPGCSSCEIRGEPAADRGILPLVLCGWAAKETVAGRGALIVEPFQRMRKQMQGPVTIAFHNIESSAEVEEEIRSKIAKWKSSMGD